jgi:hypothetical protein
MKWAALFWTLGAVHGLGAEVVSCSTKWRLEAAQGCRRPDVANHSLPFEVPGYVLPGLIRSGLIPDLWARFGLTWQQC